MGKNFLAFLAAVITFQLLSSAAIALTASDAYGKPHNVKGPRYEIWRDHDQWHLRWTGAGAKHHFTGRITAPEGDVYLDEKVNWEKREDKIWKEDRGVRFDSWAKGAEDGFDFRWSGDKLVIDLEIDGRFNRKRIYIGADSNNPAQHPFQIYRRDSYSDRGPEYAHVIYAQDAYGKPHNVRGPRYEIWRDHDHWHLRWTGAGAKHHFTGRITAPEGDVYLDEKVNWEKREDKIWKEDKGIRFDSWAKGAEDGFDFRWSGDELVIDLEIDGRVSKHRIFIGADSIHPESSHFVIYRNQGGKKGRREYQDRKPQGFPSPPIYRY